MVIVEISQHLMRGLESIPLWQVEFFNFNQLTWGVILSAIIPEQNVSVFDRDKSAFQMSRYVTFTGQLEITMICMHGTIDMTDLLTYCRFASQFLVCDTLAASSICDADPLQHFLSCSRSVISARSLL